MSLGRVLLANLPSEQREQYVANTPLKSVTPRTIIDPGRLARELRLTQERLAELASCSKPSVVAAELGKPTMRLDKLLAILTVLGLSIEITQADGNP